MSSVGQSPHPVYPMLIGKAAHGALRYPDFICIGAQKAGTTWLHDKLGQHPDLWLPPLKEIHFFDALHTYSTNPEGRNKLDRLRVEATTNRIESVMRGGRSPNAKAEALATLRLMEKRELTDEWYGRIFQAAPAMSKCGEITPEYALLPDAGVEHMLGLGPAAKLIFVLRDPIDRAWSHVRMLQTRMNPEEASRANISKTIISKPVISRSDYMVTIDRLKRFVTDDRLLLLYFDDLSAHPAETLYRVYEFIGVNPARARARDIQEPRYQGRPMKLAPELYEQMKRMLQTAYGRLRVLDNPIVDRWIEKHYGLTRDAR